MVQENQHGQVIAQYRKAKKWSQEELAGALRVDTRTVQRMEQQSMIKNIDRRRLLVGLLGIPAALLGLEVEQQKALEAPMAINTDRMSFFEEEMAARWDMYHIGGTKRASRGLEVWLSEMARFARSAQNSVWHERALALLSMSYQLQSCVSRDLMNYPLAHKAIKEGYRVAKELGDIELMAIALTREGITLIQEDQPIDAIRHLNGALKLINNAGLSKLRAYALQALSEAYAKTQQTQQSWQCVILAERLLENCDTSPERYQARINTASLIAQKGVNAVLLKEHDRAIALIDKSLIHYDPTMLRGKARLLAQKAEAYYGLSVIDASTNMAEEALSLARSVGSTKTIARVEMLHQTMRTSRYGKETSVARPGALLVSQK